MKIADLGLASPISTLSLGKVIPPTTWMAQPQDEKTSSSSSPVPRSQGSRCPIPPLETAAPENSSKPCPGGQGRGDPEAPPQRLPRKQSPCSFSLKHQLTNLPAQRDTPLPAPSPRNRAALRGGCWKTGHWDPS